MDGWKFEIKAGKLFRYKKTQRGEYREFCRKATALDKKRLKKMNADKPKKEEKPKEEKKKEEKKKPRRRKRFSFFKKEKDNE